MGKLLLCDDSLLIRVQLRDFVLSKYPDIQIFEAKNGSEAYEIYKREVPQLVIMDVVMPDMDGLESLSKIVADFPLAKVIILSSVGNKEILRKALQLGACDFMQKPWNDKLITKAIIQHIKGVDYIE